MDTYFAPAERASGDELQRDIVIASAAPLVSGLLRTAGGVLAVLNAQRQILAVNDAFLKMLGAMDAGKVLGLRPGEAINCIHAREMAGGCGTSRFCSTCGAAIAIVACLAGEKPEERKCAVTVKRDSRTLDLCFRVRSSLVTFEGRLLILLFLQDITASQRWAAAEHVFFHDINNLVMGVQGTSELMNSEEETDLRKLARNIHQTSVRLGKEIAIQQALLRDDLSEYQLLLQEVTAEQVVRELRAVFAGHQAAEGKFLNLGQVPARRPLVTDLSLLLRVLTNMLINAFEATDKGGGVRLWVEEEKDAIAFCVWNEKAMPEDVARRVFQRYFSTKKEPGRGSGTYAMKLLGESLLGGRVDFTTSEADGTVFRFHLPV